MSSVQVIPITPEVLTWAITDAGYPREEIAAAIGVSVTELLAWERGEAAPPLSKARELAARLHRTLAFLLLPHPPGDAGPEVKFRQLPHAAHRQQLTPEERRYIRRAVRIQRALGWIAKELNEPDPRVRRFRVQRSAEAVAKSVRQSLAVDVTEQVEWETSSIAFDRWRERLEAMGVVTFLFPIGDESCRGFSIWDDRVPMIAVNTAWNEEARVFTMFHELGHLLTRTNSVCAEGAGDVAIKPASWDRSERWCEEFAAAVLMPATALEAALRATAGKVDFATVQRLARRFHTSLRATAIRIIDLKGADWNLYAQLPGRADAKRQTGGGGGGRDRVELRHDQYGRRTAETFRRGVQREVMSRPDALSYLGLSDSEFDRLTSS